MAGLPGRRMMCLLVFLCVAAAVGSETETKDEKTRCIQNFVEWCNNKQYPQEGASGLTMVSISYRDDTNYYRVFCSSDADGTNCSRNGSPWFTCTPDHVLTYKGEVLTEATPEVDDDICKAQQKAFNELLVNDNSTLSVFEKELKSFFSEILAMRRQVYELHKRLGDVSFMGDDFWGGLDDFTFDNNGEESMKPIEKKDTNQIEKE